MIRIVLYELTRAAVAAVSWLLAVMTGAVLDRVDTRILDALVPVLWLLMLVAVLTWAIVRIKPKGVR